MSEVNEFEVVEYLDEARERYTEVFKNKPMFDRFVRLMLENSVDIQLALKDLMQKRSIDTAVGAQLDILGDIVGQPRELIGADLLSYFGFLGSLRADSLGDRNSPTLGGTFYDLGSPLSGNLLLSDEQYRLFIKAKIIRNTTDATPNQLLEFVNFLFRAPGAIIAEGDAAFTLLFGRELTQFERVALTYVSTSQGFQTRLIPKPTGVRVTFGEFDTENVFAFQGVPNAKGFSELSGTFGYGLGYGMGYGDSDFTAVGGGKFATLYEESL